MRWHRRGIQLPADLTLPGSTIETIKRYCDSASNELARITGHKSVSLPDSNNGSCCYQLDDPVPTPRLRVLRAHQKHLLPRMSIRLYVDGHSGHASVHIADCRAMVWQNSLSALALAQWAASVLIPVLEDRVGVLRVVRRQNDNDGRGPDHVSSDHLVDAERPEPTPALVGGDLCEAILWTWSGKGDRHVVLPHYAQ